MIKSFGCKETKKLITTGKCRIITGAVAKKALLMLDRLDSITRPDELYEPKSNRLHKLSGDKKDFWSISINMQWRIIFRFESQHAYDVEITDYH